MSAPCLQSFFSDLSTTEQAAVLAHPDATYRVLYWSATSAGSTVRDLLSYGKASWKNQFPKPEDWQNGSGTIPTPFRVMPVLNVIAPNGKEVFIAETIVVDTFLAKRFNLLGDNEYEEMTIKGFYSNIHYLRERSFMTMTWTYDDKREEAVNRWMTRNIPRFIEDHEFHLKANGNNGHYVGNRLSLADIHLANMIDHFATLPSAEVTTALFKKSELWKVKEGVEKNPDIAAWRATDEYKQTFNGSVQVYAITAVVPKDKESEKSKEA